MATLIPMKSMNEFRKEVRRESQLKARLSLAKARLEEAQQEHIWAIASAHSQGLSIRKIATETGLSSSRVHQLLHSDEAELIPEFLSSSNLPQNREGSTSQHDENFLISKLEHQISQETEVLRWCLNWLEQLETEDRVVVNLRAECDIDRAFVGVDRQWVLRVLRRVTADLDRLSRHIPPSEEMTEGLDPIAEGVRHRRRLGEPEPSLSSLSMRQQRELLREKLFHASESRS